MQKIIILALILIAVGLYFFWTEFFLRERVIKKNKTYKSSNKDSLGNAPLKHQRVASIKSVAEVARDITILERKFLVTMFFLLGVGAYLLLFGAFSHYNTQKGKFVETEKSWRSHFFK